MERLDKSFSFENEILRDIEEKIIDVSEMTHSERVFFNNIIRKTKPKKILELGIAAGASSAIILNAIKDDDDAHLYSIDYSERYCRDSTKKSGFLVEERFPELSAKWSCYLGKLGFEFMEEIGGEIDLCLLDTRHRNPGEILDFLMILPFMKKNGIIIIHDISLHVSRDVACDEFYFTYVTCGQLFSAIKGTKILPNYTEHYYFPNIGMITLSDDINNDVISIFNLLTQPWSGGIPSTDELSSLREFLKKYYSQECMLLFDRIVEYNYLMLSEGRKGLGHLESSTKEVKSKNLPQNKRRNKVSFSFKNLLKSYLFFPWYVYVTYSNIKNRND